MMPWTRAPRLLLAATLLSALSALHAQPAIHAASLKPQDTPVASSVSPGAGGTVWAWGWNVAGELGVVDDAVIQPQIVQSFPSFDPVVKVALGGIHTLAVTRHGAVYALGSDNSGQLGLGPSHQTDTTPFQTNVPTLVSGLPRTDPVTSVAAGSYDSLVLTRSGRVYAWGDNVDGELGNNAWNEWLPVQVLGLPQADPVVAIAAGALHNLALTKSGQVYAWGDNTYGELGNDVAVDHSDQPLLVSGLPAIDPVVAIAAGYGDSLALTAHGRVYSWGWDNSGQAGHSATNGDTAVPAQVQGLPDNDAIITIAAGDSFSLALGRSGRVYAWGNNDVGQLGVTNDVPSPLGAIGIRALPDSDPVTAIAAGNGFGLALTHSGVVYAWGDDSRGALGDGGGVDGLPRVVPHLKHIIAISAGVEDAAAIEAPSTPALLHGAGPDALSPLLAGWQPSLAMMEMPLTITYAVTDEAHSLDQWTAGAADFAAHDGPLSPTQEQTALAHCGGPAIHLPIAVGGVALTYNLPGLDGRLTLSPHVVARLLLGGIRDWGDVDVQRLNPGVRLPHLPVRVVYRADTSGATALLTSYLSAVDPAWQARVGSGDTVRWPSGRGALGSLGVAARVLRTPGAIGYVDLADALMHHLPIVALLNGAGKAVAPGVAGVEAAARSAAARMPADLQEQLGGAASRDAYPLAGYLYVSLCGTVPAATGAALNAFLRYALTEGQAAEPSLGYAPLPAGVQAKAVAALGRLSLRQPEPKATPTAG